MSADVLDAMLSRKADDYARNASQIIIRFRIFKQRRLRRIFVVNAYYVFDSLYFVAPGVRIDVASPDFDKPSPGAVKSG